MAPLSFLSSSDSDPSDRLALVAGELLLALDLKPDDLGGGEADPRTLLLIGEEDLRSLLVARCACFRGGELDILFFIAFLGEREPEELLPDEDAERERLLRIGERLCLCLELVGPRLGGLLRRGDGLLLGLCLLRGE